MKRLNLTNLSPIFKRIGSLIAAISGLAGIAAVLLVYYPPDHQNAKLVGRWESDYSYPITGGTASFQGKTDLFREGKYNVNGIMTLEGVVENKPYKFTYNVVGAGVWTADSERMSISLTNMKSITKSLSLAGVKIPPELAVRLSGQPLPSLSDAYPEGMSEEYELQSIASDVVVLKTKDPFGKPFTFEMHRKS
ncbi:hypothetical protein BVY11_28410 [Pseudomonas amygdali pv. morsprunorum]|uniref:Uncharacterized protein n=2 Tax=Pseudomonas syringae group TaxID=136849 RepID=A0A0N8R3L6_PSESX|nr:MULTISPECIES: hypothetical protein [Pseudomonas syringae group]PPS23995.1 hypothetical protein BVY11_28410 [Pseudomonas amygdali pv. morsprunorum]KPW89934.1 Uncharacterized protein ALO79_03169 [Pseudomonas syringae pv. castaneae]KWS98190.1 hypothetical protein AL048_14280 [Pseudomonas syringae pv. castaneae]PPS36811.1 hypothetical protein BVY12_10290 [Pseudomonas amygdali pv. morsprunorum]RMS84614.1 hypothetical protein ALP58_02350 [Pseudomonas savastanoi]